MALELISPLVHMYSFDIDERCDYDNLGSNIVLWLRIISRLCLVAAYGTGYCWIYLVRKEMGDVIPLAIVVTDAIRSGTFLLLVTWSIIPQRRPTLYTPFEN